IIKDADGTTVRQLVTGEFLKKGKHEIPWDGLTNPFWKTPGKPVAPGTYTWHAIWHKGASLKFRGWAYHGSSDPWDASPTTYWGGDHALAISCHNDGERVYLGWAGSEAGKALIATDLDGNVQWAAGQHFNACILIGSDAGVVYYVDAGTLKRVNAKDGKPVNWPGRDTADIPIGSLWGDEKGLPSQLTWMWADGFAVRDGKMYLAFSSWDWARGDVIDWRAFLTKVKADERVGKIIWDKIDGRCKDIITRWLAGDQAENDAFKAPNYYTPDVRDVVVGVLQSLLSEKSFVDGGDKLSREKLAEASRRLVEQTFGDCLAKKQTNLVAVVDIQTQKLLKKLTVDVPGKMVPAKGNTLVMFKGRDSVISLNTESGEISPIITGLKNPSALALDDAGSIYVSLGDPVHYIEVYSPDGKLTRTIGKKGGRPRVGVWDPNGIWGATGLTIDPKGKLWVAECDIYPKRFSVWDAKTGKFIAEYLGPTHYGASGGTVNPRDPDLLVGEGCEFRIDPKTGQSKLLGIITQEIHNGCVRFCEGSNGKQYLAGSFSGRVWGAGEPPQINIYERLGEGDWAHRGEIRAQNGKTHFWADVNGDQIEQPDEVATMPVQFGMGGYLSLSMNMNTDLTFYGTGPQGKCTQVKVTSFTKCGAPKYDIAGAKELPTPALGAPLSSPDNSMIASCEESIFRCYDTATGKLRWSYPSTYSGVHGSHGAPGPFTGLIRGAFGYVGNAKLPKPLGNVWAINTNVGEWHMLNEDGHYVTRIFQPDGQKWRFPEKALPGVDVTDIPPGLGGEDFGGSLIQAKDGKIYLQAGKVALWAIELTGLETAKEIKGGKIKVSEKQTFEAQLIRGQLAQVAVGAKSVKIKRMTQKLTGNIDADFHGAEHLRFKKQDNAEVKCAAAYDNQNLYLCWEVQDATPWVNGADQVEYMYTKGDTVDFQLGTDPKADRGRGDAAAGDLRISIGNFKRGDAAAPAVVIYRPLHAEKKPMKLSSGVVKNYTLDSVVETKDVQVVVKTRDKGYLIEAAVPLSTLGVKSLAGLKLRGDFGATHSDAGGQETAQRTHWSNQATGIVNDEVFELKLEPRNWGELVFEE
ncbi:MAG TPA: hypothetical protein VM141_08595, partial [Planctomycetota bacterium]|nr:hypothetical protein [Planctomycetota bacterium]